MSRVTHEKSNMNAVEISVKNQFYGLLSSQKNVNESKENKFGEGSRDLVPLERLLLPTLQTVSDN